MKLPVIIALSMIVGSCAGDPPSVTRHPDNPGDVPVTPPPGPEDPSDDKPGDEDKPDQSLDDHGMRFQSSRIDLRFTTPGTLFVISAERSTVTVRSLTTGDVVTAVFDSPIERAAAGSLVWLTVNDTPSEATVEAIRHFGDNGIAMRIVGSSGTSWLVTDGL